MNYKYCPWCGKKLVKKDDYFECTSCGKSVFLNSFPGAGALIIKNNKILLAIRAKDPHKGKLDIPGGFLKCGELPEVGLKREIKEETSLDIKIIKLHGIYINHYEYQGIEYKALDLFYRVKITKGTPKAQDDVAELKWYKIDKIPLGEICFKSNKKALRDLQKMIK